MRISEDLLNELASEENVLLMKIMGSLFLGVKEGYSEILIVKSDGHLLRIIPLNISGHRVMAIYIPLKQLLLDLTKGLYGGIFRSRIILPGYVSMGMQSYLRIKTKALVNQVYRSMKNLVWEFGRDFSRNICLSPKFFLYDILARRTLPLGVNDPLVSLYAQKHKVFEEHLTLMFEKLLDKMVEKKYLSKNGSLYCLKNEIVEELGVPPTYSILNVLRGGFKLLSESLSSIIRPPNYLESLIRAIILENKEGVVVPDPYSQVFIRVNGTLHSIYTDTISPANIVEEKNLGSIINYTKLLVVRDSTGRDIRLVLKKYREWRGIKWVPLAVWAGIRNEFTASPSERLAREYFASLLLNSRKLPVPKPIYVNWEKKILLREYIEGTTLSALLANGADVSEHYSALGKIVGLIHNMGMSIGDLRPSNIVIERGTNTPFIIDLEQASAEREVSWDISELISFTALDARYDVKKIRDLLKSFFESYISIAGKENIIKAFSPKYMRVFAPILPIPLAYVLKKEVERVGGKI